MPVRGGWEIEFLDFRPISPLSDPTLQMQLGPNQPERLGAYTQALTIDLRDNQLEPRLGAYAELRVDEGTRYAGGAFDFIRVTPEMRGYVPVPGLAMVLAARARVGRFYGDVPVTE